MAPGQSSAPLTLNNGKWNGNGPDCVQLREY